jgi:NDP-sugar pyrophosphorylase family protein
MNHKYKNDKLIIVIPMAGAGSRFETAGYTFPKPLIEVNGKTMIQTVVDSLNIDAKYVFIVRNEHNIKYSIENYLKTIVPNCEVVFTDGLTEGAACTVLLSKNLIDNENPILMANSDQWIDWDNFEFMKNNLSNNLDASILTFNSTHPKWSFVKISDEGLVTEVAEKKPISDIATVGVYWWAKGSDFVKYAEQMISKNIRVNNEFYVCPVFNEAIEDNKRIGVFKVNEMWGLGTPEDLNYFLSSKCTQSENTP